MKKRIITISAIGIVLITVMILGVTYAYYINNVYGNTKSKSIDVIAGTMAIKFNDITVETNETIAPGYEMVKVFTVENVGDVDASYYIKLVDVVNNFNRTQDITYTLYRTDGLVEETIDNNTDLSSWTEVVSGIFPESDILLPTIETISAKGKNATENTFYTYVLKIVYINHPTENQNEDKGNVFGTKINVVSSPLNNYLNGTLAYNIINNGALVSENVYDKTITEITSFSGVSDGTNIDDSGIFVAEDDYGLSYYYRGVIKNNYVNFAGFTWRIVRINGDGSVRLILDGTLDKVYKQNSDGTYSTSPAGQTVYFNTSSNSNAYVGYMYGDPIGSDYKSTHVNSHESVIKEYIDDLFYEEYIIGYKDYLADSIFCGDKTLAPGYESSGYGPVTTHYGASSTPTLKCAEGASNTYSRYTAEAYTTQKGVETNGDLDYPIALISEDEVIMAGGYFNKANTAYYLYNSESTYFSWWTMTAYEYSLDPWVYLVNYGTLSTETVGVGSKYGVRPVINLKANTLVDGNGTSGNPYKIK